MADAKRDHDYASVLAAGRASTANVNLSQTVTVA